MLRLVVPVVLLSAASAMAQQTGLTGKVTDASGAVIAGATVDVKQAGASTFHTRSNGDGSWTLPSLPAGDYLVTVTSSGFSTMETKISVLVGQTPSVDSVLPAAGGSTSVVVTAEAVAIDTTSSAVAGNITPQEVQGVPINGRNYMSLATLVPGVRINAITADVPVGSASESGKFQITMDGLQVSQDTAGSSFGQPRFSQDAIAQFQIITNRFDATLGRSAGVYVNSQSKSGTNTLHGGLFGYFRNDALNAADPISKTVLPFSDQQFGGTLGGKIKTNKLWYFGSYEGERQPSTSTSTPLTTNTVFTNPGLLRLNEYLGRGDYQINDKNHILLRGDGFTYNSNYLGVTGSADPSRAYQGTRTSYGFTADWNSNISSSLVNDLRVGYHHFGWQNLPFFLSMELILPTSTIGGPYNYPQIFSQDTQQYRDDIFWLKGKHSIKAGAEYIYTAHGGFFQQNVRGRVSACSSSKTLVSTPNINSATQTSYNILFPTGTTDFANWNLSAISNYCNTGLTYIQGFGNFTVDVPRSILGIWLQDDWKVMSRLTLNLGLRFDDDLGAFTGGPKLNNGLLVPKGNDNNNISPRIGFAYDVMGDGKTSVRGGAGIYFADVSANQIIDQQIFNGVSTIQASVTGTNGSVNLANPFGGGNPAANPAAYTQAVQPLAQDAKVPYALQASFGVQRELPGRIMMNADLVHTRTYHDWVRAQGNLLVDPANPQRALNANAAMTATNVAAGLNCGNGSVALQTPTAFSAATKLVCNQAFTNVQQFFTPAGAGSVYDALQLGLHKSVAKYSAGIAYTWGRTKNSTEGPFYYPNKPFLKDIKSEWANGTDDQRHSLTVNGEYKFPLGLSLSGLYRFGSGLAYATSTGGSNSFGYAPSFNRTLANGAIPIAAGTTCPTGSTCFSTYAPVSKFKLDTGIGNYVMDRNTFRGIAYHRADARLQETFPIHERYKAIVAVEAFNLFNHSNYSAYQTTANNLRYGLPTTAGGGGVLEYAARQLQFLVRFQF
ncbi:TonB-dependent receptor [Terriglobus roseus]|nr:carboxypeptidase regulatory-like domain-containing protein [Terriglobus roseus]